MKENRKFHPIAGLLLVALGVGLIILGIGAVPHAGAEDPLFLWVLYFGGSVLLVALGMTALRKRSAN